MYIYIYEDEDDDDDMATWRHGDMVTYDDDIWWWHNAG